MGTRGAKLEKEDVEAPDSTIRVRMFYESDLTLYLSMILVVSRNGESSLILSIIIGTYGIYVSDKHKIKKFLNYFKSKAAND